MYITFPRLNVEEFVFTSQSDGQGLRKTSFYKSERAFVDSRINDAQSFLHQPVMWKYISSNFALCNDSFVDGLEDRTSDVGTVSISISLKFGIWLLR
jgi:hypothetical protein